MLHTKVISISFHKTLLNIFTSSIKEFAIVAICCQLLYKFLLSKSYKYISILLKSKCSFRYEIFHAEVAYIIDVTTVCCLYNDSDVHKLKCRKNI